MRHPSSTETARSQQPEITEPRRPPRAPVALGIVAVAMLLLGGAPPLRAETGGTIHMPLEAYLRLLTASGTSPVDAPPVDYLLPEASYAVTVGEHGVTIDAVIRAEVLASKWVQVPVLPYGVAIEWATLDGRPVTLHNDDAEGPSLVLNRPGSYTVKARLRVPLDTDRGERALSFDIVPSAIARVRVTVPEPDLEFTVYPEEASSLVELRTTESTVAIILPAGETDVDVEWHEAPATDAEATTRLVAESATVLHFDDGVVKATAVVKLDVARAPISEVVIALPAEVESASVEGDAILGHTERVEGKRRLVTVQFPYPVVGETELTLTYEIALPDDRAAISVPTPSVEGAARDTGTISLSAISTLEINVPNEESAGVTSIDPSEVPDWAPAGETGDPLLFAFKYHAYPRTIVAHVIRHEDTEVLTTSIDLLGMTTVITREGKTITRARMLVSNNLKQFLRVDLPDGHTLWSAFVGGRPVKPARDGSAEALLVPLLRSSYVGGHLAPFEVELIYYGERDAISGLAGRGELTAPITDVPVTRMSWDLYLPPGNSYVHPSGDLRIAPDRASDSFTRHYVDGSIGGAGEWKARDRTVLDPDGAAMNKDVAKGRKDAADEPAPAKPAGREWAAMAGERISLEESGHGIVVESPGFDSRKVPVGAAGYLVTTIPPARPAAKLVKGVLPVRVRLPIGSDAQLLSFEKEIVEAGESATIRFAYVDEDLRDFLGASAWPLLFVFALALFGHGVEALRRRRLVIHPVLAAVGGAAALVLATSFLGAELSMPSVLGPAVAAGALYLAWAAYTRRLRVPAVLQRAWASRFSAKQEESPAETPQDAPTATTPAPTVDMSVQVATEEIPAGTPAETPAETPAPEVEAPESEEQS